MNILVIADDDAIAGHMPEIRAELLLSCGDLPDDLILRVAQQCRCQEVFAVKGNHDSSGPFRSPIRDLHLQTLRFGHLNFGGFCGSWKYKPRGNYLFDQSEVETALKAFPAVDVLMTHNSPRHVHDRDDEVHTGFVAFNSYLTRHRPKFLFHGHQHINQETVVATTRVIGVYGFRQVTIPS